MTADHYINNIILLHCGPKGIINWPRNLNVICCDRLPFIYVASNGSLALSQVLDLDGQCGAKSISCLWSRWSDIDLLLYLSQLPICSSTLPGQSDLHYVPQSLLYLMCCWDFMLFDFRVVLRGHSCWQPNLAAAQHEKPDSKERRFPVTSEKIGSED